MVLSSRGYPKFTLWYPGRNQPHLYRGVEACNDPPCFLIGTWSVSVSYFKNPATYNLSITILHYYVQYNEHKTKLRDTNIKWIVWRWISLGGTLSVARLIEEGDPLFQDWIWVFQGLVWASYYFKPSPNVKMTTGVVSLLNLLLVLVGCSLYIVIIV